MFNIAKLWVTRFVHFCDIPVLSLVPEYSGTVTEPEFWRWLLRKRCTHIGAQLRIVPGHHTRTQSVNKNLQAEIWHFNTQALRPVKPGREKKRKKKKKRKVLIQKHRSSIDGQNSEF